MATIFFCNHQLVRKRLVDGAGLSLPALSFAALVTGFSLSLNLPSSLHMIIPVMKSLFFVSLPHIWRGFLSWITPPCLFVLLNGIIMILTATSGSSFSSSKNDSSVIEPNSSTLTENVLFKQNAAGLEQALVPTPHAAPAPILDDAEDIVGPELDTQILDATEDDEQPEPFHEAIRDNKQLVLVICTKESSMQFANVACKQEFLCHDSSTSSSSSLCCDSLSSACSSRPSLFSCKSCGTLSSYSSSPPSSSCQSSIPLADASASSECEEISKVMSEPSSPHFEGHVMKNNMRRSISIDSASLAHNREEQSDDQLSEEAFKKRIDDFILKVTSKLSNETRVAR